MKILITGATGFIGNHLVSNLLNRDNLHLICNGRSPSSEVDFKWKNNVEYIQQDLNNSKQNWYSYFKDPDILIHLAWGGLPNYKEPFHLEKNLPSDIKFIKNMLSNGLKNLVVIGTCFEYGLKEGELNENDNPSPIVSYAVAKNELRKTINNFRNEFDFIFKWIRPFYLYGKGQNENSIFAQLNNALDKGYESFDMSKGEQIRDFLPIEEAVNLIGDIVLQNEINGIINCCSGEPIKLIDLVNKIIKKSKKSINLNLGCYPYPDYEPFSFYGSRKKLNKIISKSII